MNKLLLLLKKSYFLQTETRATNKITKSKIVQTNGFGFSPFAGTRSLKTATVEEADKALLKIIDSTNHNPLINRD